MIDFPHILLGLVLGAVFGAVGGLFGIGGGLVAIPVLGVFFGLDEQHAQGTAMVMVAPNVLVGLVNYARRGGMDRRIALALAVSAIPLTFLGAQIATHVASAPLRRFFALFLVAIAVYFLSRVLLTKRGEVAVATGAPWALSVGVGAFGGLLSGLFSVGGAVFAVPTLAIVYGLSQATAQGLGLAMVAPGTIVALGTYAGAHDVDWGLAIPLAVGGMLFVSRGVALAYRLPERVLRMLFIALVLASAAALWTHA